MDDERLYFVASDISIAEQKLSDIFLCIEMRMLSTRPNTNHEGVTEAFIDEIVSNPDKYSCLPLYVDIDKMLSKDYRALGHMYDKYTRKFHTTQVGGMRSFRKVSDEFGVSLVGEARIPRREYEICRDVLELYSIGQLNFSFEIKYDVSNTIVKDGVRYVDASENNVLTGMAIVSVPAYRESKALSLVAEEAEEDGNTDGTNDAGESDNEDVGNEEKTA